MKFNGKNIITDKDITVTGAQNLGDNLSDILQKHQKELESLKGNVKWLYKYGGTGSGGGGGTGSGGSDNWEIFATLSGRTLSNGNTISLSKSENSNYILNLSIKNGNGYYSVSIYYDDGKSTQITLSPDNGWKTTLTLYLPKNAFINIIAEDGSNSKQLECDYITNPYNFNNNKIALVNNNNIEYQDISGDILFSDARNNGLIAKINYEIAIEAETYYHWAFNNTITESVKIEANKGTLEFSIPEDFLNNNDNAGLYEIICIIEITPKNQEKEIITLKKSFNLIPSTLYLKVTPEIGDFYKEPVEIGEENDLNVYKFKTSSTISFNVRAYKGSNQNRNGNLTCTTYDNISGDDNLLDVQTLSITENINKLVSIYYTTPGWKRVVLECSLQGSYYATTRYLYIEEVKSDYNWYKQSAEPSTTNYYRIGDFDKSKKLSSIFSGIYFQNSSSSSDRKINSNYINIPQQGGDMLISLGIQYNEINNINDPIITFNYSNDSLDAPFCCIYQNKIVIENSYTNNIFLEKTTIEDYNITKPQNYHLIQILVKQTYRDPNNVSAGDYKQICIYIDGVLDSALQNWFNYTRLISSIVLHPGNYSINLLELSYFSNYITRSISDIDINYYYNTYQIKSNAVGSIPEDETALLECFYEYDNLGNTSMTYSIENEMIKLNGSGIISTISKHTKIPTLVCRIERYLTSFDSSGNTSVFDWINLRSTTEQDSVTGEGTVDTGLQAFKCPVLLRWYNNPSGGGIGIDFTDPNRLMSGASMFNDSNIEFYLRLQGSSTMRYKSKNLTLGVTRTSVDDNAPQPVFSPNFLPNDKTTFLPDEAFTLKADVVDSSHSNNTCLGKFINKVYIENEITSGNPEGELRNHVRTCLEGFPILLFLEISDTNSGTAAKENEYYYLGIYNFNLGRENQLNLGYIPTNPALNGITGGVPNEYSFFTHLIPKDYYKPVNNLIIAEVQGNDPMWDFSQYDNTILFRQDKITGDSNYMFGDIIYGSSQNNSYKNNIATFVKNVSGAGNYIFTSLGKVFEDIVDPQTGNTISHIAYRTVNTVPNADSQYIRNLDGKTYSKIDRNSDVILLPTRGEQDFNINLLYNCIFETESGDKTVPEYLDYNSAVYYYTICMAFGLVDSVQKNLNIKSWNGKTFGLYFYDMDTALGTSNSGGNTSYFCFSDFWKTGISELRDEEGKLVVDSEGNPVYKNSAVNVFRDHYPEDKSLPAGYDIPSTYLFAISKYAACFESELSNSDSKVQLISPQKLWANWRKKGGILESADTFIDNYFKDHLANVPNTLLNLNYRNKYLYTNTNSSGDFAFNSTDIENLKGRQIQRVRDWLTSRFHLLDAYFNLSNESVLIYQTPDKTKAYFEPLNDIDDLNKNTDIIILHDIFSPGDSTIINRDGKLNFRIKARNYTPLIHRHAGSIERLLLEDENTEYAIELNYNGNQTSKFGGSDGWTYLDSLNSFILTLQNGGFYVVSKRLEHIEGTEGSLTGGINLIIPSAKTLKLTSPDYNCEVNINDSFYNLTNIDISNSKIKLTVEGSKVTSLNLNKIKSERIILNSCNYLEEVNLNEATISEFTATPIWSEVKDVLDLSGIKTRKLTLDGKSGNGELKIIGSEDLETLVFSKFKKITISGCPKLKQVTCNDGTISYITELSIVGAPLLNEVIILSDDLNTLDLSGCIALTTLELRKTNSQPQLNKLKTLNLSSTNIKRIKRTCLNNNDWVEIDGSLDYLDLRHYPNLETFKIDNNNQLEYVIVNNDENNPYCLNYYYSSDLNKTISSFALCSNLKRIYGHVKLTNSNSFYECNNFSIHGFSEIENEEGEIIHSLNNIKYNGVNILEGNTIKHPQDFLFTTNKDKLLTRVDGEEDKYKMTFQEGTEVTNITFSGSSLYCDFYRTSCTIFDIYYVFQNLQSVDNEKVNVSCCFQNIYPKRVTTGLDIHRFNWTLNYDNSPHTSLFKDWGYKLGNISSLFYGSTTKFRIFSTELNNTGEVIKPGLYYYLPNITNISTIFHGGEYYTDKNVFLSNENDGKYSKLTDISYFNPKLIINNINNLNSADLFKEENKEINLDPSKILKYLNQGDIGDFDNLLDNCPNLTVIKNVLNSVYFINYDKFKIKIPDSVTDIVYSFNSSYATGELNLSSVFKTTSSNNILTAIDQSFVVNNTTISNISPNLTNARFGIDNNTFKKFTKLTSIGYRTNNIDAAGKLTSNNSSFGGFNKYLKNGFPYDIINHLSNLTTFSGFFRDCDSINNNNYDEIELPGRLFNNNPKLSNISRCFQNFKGKIKLTSGGFTNCRNLANVSYLFCISDEKLNELTHDGYEELGIISCIPNKFFYHGLGNPTVLNITGTNQTVKINTEGMTVDSNQKTLTKIESVLDEVTNENINVETVISGYIIDNSGSIAITPISTITTTKTTSNNSLISSETIQAGNSSYFNDLINNIEPINIPNPLKTITNMSYCFQGQGWISEYEYEVQTSDKEPESSYQPFKYVKLNDNNEWVDKSSTYQDKQYTYMWVFDGYNKFEEDNGQFYSLDDNVDTTNINKLIIPGSNNLDSENCTSNFFCPPDLFRYCTDSVNIEYIFNNCGYSSHIYLANELLGSINQFIGFGITGRICPYLLKPIPGITSLAYFLNNAKRLSYYTVINDNDNTYVIPKSFFDYTPSIANLTGSFKGMCWPKKCKMDIFSKLTKTLTVDYTFRIPFFDSSASEPFSVSGVFLNKGIASAKATFSIEGNMSATLQPNPSYVTSQYVNFGVNFTKTRLPKENDVSYDNLKIKHVYDGFSSKTVSFGGLDANNNSLEFQTHNTNLSALPYNYRTRG